MKTITLAVTYFVLCGSFFLWFSGCSALSSKVDPALTQVVAQHEAEIQAIINYVAKLQADGVLPKPVAPTPTVAK